MSIVYSPIGYFRTPFKEIKGMPIQVIGGTDVEGHIEVLPDYAAGLQDLDGFSHVIVLCHLHQIAGHDLVVQPFLDNARHHQSDGRFAV